jgi:hypothetical protein
MDPVVGHQIGNMAMLREHLIDRLGWSLHEHGESERFMPPFFTIMQ